MFFSKQLIDSAGDQTWGLLSAPKFTEFLSKCFVVGFSIFSVLDLD